MTTTILVRFGDDMPKFKDEITKMFPGEDRVSCELHQGSPIVVFRDEKDATLFTLKWPEAIEGIKND